MKSREKVFLIIADLLIFILLIYPIFKGAIIGGYDPGFHMARINTLASNISSGHFPNPIGFEYLNKFGYGIGFFYGNFFIYPFAILNALGMSAYHSYIVYLITFVILNILSINYVIHKLFNNTWATILSAPIYLSSYYIFDVLYMRAAAGELIAFALIPWILLSTFKLIKGETKYWLMLAISLGLLLVTHILSFLITVGTVLIIFIMNLIPILKDRKLLISFVKAGIVFIGLTSAFLFPFIQQYFTQSFVDTSMDSKGNYAIIANSMLMHNHIFDTLQYLAINGIFLVSLLIVSLGIHLYLNRGFHFHDKVISQSYIIILIYSSLLLSTDLLKFAVKIFRPLVLLQVIPRLNVVLLPLFAFVITNALGLLINHFGQYKIPVTAALLVITALVSIAVPIQKEFTFVADRKGTIAPYSTSMGEYEPKNFMAYNLANNFKVNNQFLEKQEDYKITTNNHHELIVNISTNKSSRIIMLPRLYYKGYQTRLTYNNTKVKKTTLIKNGLVSVKLPGDFHSGKVIVTYETTNFAKLGWAISIITICLLSYLKFKRSNYFI